MKPVQAKACSIKDVMAQMKARIDEENRRVAAMTPEQLAEHVEQEKRNAVAREKILKQLRGPGFTEFNVGGKKVSK